jgi:hypothetical protein
VDLPRQAGTGIWNGFGLLCELDWLVSFCVSCLLTTLLLLRCVLCLSTLSSGKGYCTR